MTTTDFFDDDLIQRREPARPIKLGPGEDRAAAGGEGGGDAPTELNLTRMARHKEEIEGQVARAVQELERLRLRQENLEKEKRELEELRRKQDEYLRGKQELIARLTQNLTLLEKEEIRAGHLLELLGSSRKKFKNMLAELQGFREESWPEEQIGAELDKALAVIDDTRVELNKTMAKVQAALGGEVRGGEKPEWAGPPQAPDSFGRWFKIGLAVTLPLMILVAVLVAGMLVLARRVGLL